MCKECKIVCDDKEIGTIICSKEGINIKFNEDTKDCCKEHHKECCH
ncbi:hypothetical protein ACFLRC_02805 [Candidatus Altiarchaeota archaeon]